MDGLFKSVLVTPQPHVSLTVSEWGDFNQAYQKYQTDIHNKTNKFELSDADYEKRAIISDIISPFFESWKNYWAQFGFMNEVSAEGLVKTLETYVTIKPVPEDCMSNTDNLNLLANEVDDVV